MTALRAKKSTGVIWGAFLLLMTAALNVMAQAPTATTQAATGIGSSGATLNGTVNANGFSTTVVFEYGLTEEYGQTWPAGQSPVSGSMNTPVSAAIAGLNPGEVLEVTATDPGSVQDMASFCGQTGHELLNHGEVDGNFIFRIRKNGVARRTA